MASNIVGTSNVWPNYYKGNTGVSSNTGNGEMGKDQFLQLLVAQLRHQDPMNPVQDKEFIAQMAQFTSLEHLMKISESMNQLNQSIGFASSLIGKTISWQVESNQSTTPIVRTGVVDAINVISGKQYAYVEGENILLDSIIRITNTEENGHDGSNSSGTPVSESNAAGSDQSQTTE